ncbi:helix-turn-helix domain-containing protein [Granulosicoccaceae sp. 1_MG-2023]|nr:helix-turn-helix domain-containing protein [Granulosicoccaceae sp. 1_MG-2023]
MHQNEKAKALKRCVSVSEDANEQADNLTNWDQEYDQIGNGRFYGRIDELHLPGLQVFNEHTSQALRQQCRVLPESIWFGLPLKTEDMRINGQQPEQTDVLCRPGDTQFELVTPANFDMLSVVVDRKELERHAAAQGIEIKLLDATSYPRLKLSQNTLRNIQFLLKRIVSTKSNLLNVQIHHDLLVMALLELLAEEKPNRTVPPSYARRKAVVDRIRHHVEAAGDAPVTMAELCEVGCVSRRTLQYSFETILGISPRQFLRASRLNRVKRMLSSAESGSVADIAAINGFYHHSQFSADYKRLFGELPSETLAHKRAACA